MLADFMIQLVHGRSSLKDVHKMTAFLYPLNAAQTTANMQWTQDDELLELLKSNGRLRVAGELSMAERPLLLIDAIKSFNLFDKLGKFCRNKFLL